MKIIGIRVYRKYLPYLMGEMIVGSNIRFSGGLTTVVVIETDAGITGSGEFCPCGENYMEAYSYGVEAAARLLAPALIGEDPRQVARIERIMDATIQGHGYAKAPFDAACWDIWGKAAEQPLWMLLGGKLTDGAEMYRMAPQKPADEISSHLDQLRQKGFRQFQVKVGCDYVADIDRLKATIPAIKSSEYVLADANQGWTVDNALRVVKATRELDYVLEQPCKTYEECQQVRRKTDLPMKLDECITDFRMVQRVVQDRGAEAICLKISKQGGLSKARRMRDYLVDHRFKVVSEDTWGGEIASAVVSHFAASTPTEFLVNTTDLHNYNEFAIGHPGPETRDGKLFASDQPGHGVEPDFEALGEPVAVYGA